MNKIFAPILVVIGILSISACGKSTSTPTQETTSKAASTVANSATASASIKDQAVEALKLDRENSNNIKVGDCFNEPNENDMTKDAKQGDLIASVPMRKCTEPHDNEVFATFNLPDNTVIPTEQQVQDAVDKNCSAPFMQYVGKNINKSKYDVAFLSPSEQTWKKGDREVTCYITAKPGQKLTQSVKGTKL